MKTKRMIVAGVVVGGLAAAGTGFGAIALASTACPVDTPSIRVCGPQSSGGDSGADGSGSTSPFITNHYGNNVLLLNDNGGYAQLNQWWNNDQSASYAARLTEASVYESPSVADNPVYVRAEATQYVQRYGINDQRNSNVGASVYAPTIANGTWAVVDVQQDRYAAQDNSYATQCNQYMQWHVHTAGLYNDNYNPGDCTVEVPEVPALPQLP